MTRAQSTPPAGERRASGREAPIAAVRREAERLADAAGARLVFGAGDARAPLVVVGEAPGEREAREGRPFVGRAGRLLDALLAEAGLDRDATWVTNVVKVRPTAGEGSRLRNRAPRVGEIKAWMPILDAEIAAIEPRLLLGLGAFAGRALVGPAFRIGRDRGRWLEGRHGRPCLITYHPAFLLRQHGEALAEARSVTAADLAAVGQRLAESRHQHS